MITPTPPDEIRPEQRTFQALFHSFLLFSALFFSFLTYYAENGTELRAYILSFK